MKVTAKILSAAAAVIMFAACATLTVTTDYDKTKNFTTFRTYALYDTLGISKKINSLNADRIIAAVKQQLASKGYTEVSSKPQFKVNIITIIKNKTSVTANTDVYGMGGPYAYGGFYRPYGYWGAMGGMATATTTFDVQNYKDGSLIIDMIDTSTRKLFWQSVGNQEIDGPVSNPDKAINDAVAKIMASFPAVGMQPAAKK